MSTDRHDLHYPTPEPQAARTDEGRLTLTGAEREALLRAWPWPKEAATTANSFEDVCDAIAAILRDRRAAWEAERVAAARAEALVDVERRVEAWIRHGEAVPSDVTDYDREIVHAELRMILMRSRAEAEGGGE